MSQYHEPPQEMSQTARDRHRAWESLMEELAAVDWYEQRIAVTGCEELKEILQHNRDEEAEHAAMVLEWLRRRDPVLDEHLREFLFTSGPIKEDEDEDEPAATGPDARSGRGLLG